MSTPLPPDPYVALGVEKDATAAQIKTTYRKLALKCHPDKVTDESKKAEASDQFHRIQQAYEILSDEGRRSRYDAQVKLVELKKQAMNNRPTVDIKTAAYEMPTSSPGRATFTARGPERVYEERRPERSDSDDYFGGPRTSSRKHNDYERQQTKKAATPRDDQERAKVFQRERKESERVLRSDKNKTRDQDFRRERQRKFSAVEEDSEAEPMYEAETRHRKTDDASWEKEQSYRPRAGREREERGRERDDYERERERDRGSRRGYEGTTQHYSRMEDDMFAYTGRDKRPSLSRTTSTRASETYIDHASGRYVRRHSTKPAASSPHPRRDRKMSVPDALDTEERRPTMTRPTTLFSSASSPSAPKLARSGDKISLGRSASMQVDDRGARDAPPFTMRRSETAPNLSPRRTKDAKSSNLRETEFSSGLPTPSASPDYPSSPAIHKTYHYPRREASREDSDRRRPVERGYERDYDREHERRLHQSPEPMHRYKSSTTAAPRYAPAPAPAPPLTRAPPSYSSSYTAEPTVAYTATRPQPARRETRDQFYSEAKSATPRASSTKYPSYPSVVTDSTRDFDRERYRSSPVEHDGSFSPKKPALSEDVRVPAGYTSRRGHSSASRPHLSRHGTSDYAHTRPVRAQ